MNYHFGEKEKACMDICGFNSYFGEYYRSRDGRIGGKTIYLPKDFTAQRYSHKANSNKVVYPNLFVDTVMNIENLEDIIDVFRAVYHDIYDFRSHTNLIMRFRNSYLSFFRSIRCGVFLRFDRVEFAFPFELFEIKVLNKGKIVIARRDLGDVISETSAGIWPVGRSGIDKKYSKLLTDIGDMPKYDD